MFCFVAWRSFNYITNGTPPFEGSCEDMVEVAKDGRLFRAASAKSLKVASMLPVTLDFRPELDGFMVLCPVNPKLVGSGTAQTLFSQKRSQS